MNTTMQILAEKQTKAGKIYLVKIGEEKPKWKFKNELPKETVDYWQMHLAR